MKRVKKILSNILAYDLILALCAPFSFCASSEDDMLSNINADQTYRMGAGWQIKAVYNQANHRVAIDAIDRLNEQEPGMLHSKAAEGRIRDGEPKLELKKKFSSDKNEKDDSRKISQADNERNALTDWKTIQDMMIDPNKNSDEKITVNERGMTKTSYAKVFDENGKYLRLDIELTEFIFGSYFRDIDKYNFIWVTHHASFDSLNRLTSYETGFRYELANGKSGDMVLKMSFKYEESGTKKISETITSSDFSESDFSIAKYWNIKIPAAPKDMAGLLKKHSMSSINETVLKSTGTHWTMEQSKKNGTNYVYEYLVNGKLQKDEGSLAQSRRNHFSKNVNTRNYMQALATISRDIPANSSNNGQGPDDQGYDTRWDMGKAFSSGRLWDVFFFEENTREYRASLFGDKLNKPGIGTTPVFVIDANKFQAYKELDKPDLRNGYLPNNGRLAKYSLGPAGMIDEKHSLASLIKLLDDNMKRTDIQNMIFDIAVIVFSESWSMDNGTLDRFEGVLNFLQKIDFSDPRIMPARIPVTRMLKRLIREIDAEYKAFMDLTAGSYDQIVETLSIDVDKELPEEFITMVELRPDIKKKVVVDIKIEGLKDITVSQLSAAEQKALEVYSKNIENARITLGKTIYKIFGLFNKRVRSIVKHQAPVLLSVEDTQVNAVLVSNGEYR